MRFPLSWLKDWVDLPEDLEEVQALLMKAGIGLEAVDNPGESLRNVVVVQVLETLPHPNADRLRLCKVSDGSRDFRIVCGAKNFETGAVVALAKDGAVLPGDFKIKKSKVRGEESEGMLCSPQELGLKPDVDGLLLLDPDLALGTPLAQALGLDDPILTLETTANRPDHLSLRGLARELAALGGLALHAPPTALGQAPASAPFQVAIQAEAACPYYTARLLSGLRSLPSPAWMQDRLQKSGIRPISAIVDVTNYVLLEHGQPLHAFDADKLSGGSLEARLARPGERLVTLDGQERLLTEDDIVIADAAGPQALGGVMGGAQSEVTDATVRVLLEAAVFPPKRVRRTSRRLGLKSESSLRFERGVDPLAVTEALDRAAQLILELVGGHLASPLLSAGSPGPAPAALAFEPQRVNALLGTRIPEKDMAALLERRFYKVARGASGWSATPPPWRRDVRAAVDLAEEVLQMAGVDSLPSSDLPQVRTPDADDTHWTNAWLLRSQLSGLGLQEALTLSFLHPELSEAWGLQSSAPRLDNPFSEDQALLRPSLLPNLVAAALASLRRRSGGIAQFELGRAFKRGSKGVEENERIAIVLAGERVSASWNEKARDWDYFDLKGLAEGLAEKLGVTFRCAGAKPDEAPTWAHPGQVAKLSLGGLQGWMGALHPALLKKLEVPKDLAQVLVLELEPHAASKPLVKEPKYAPFSRVPAVERDLSCLMDSALEAGKVLDFLRSEGGLGRARVMDRFEGEPLPPGKKSLTFRLTYTAEGRSLTDQEVNQMHQDLVGRLQTAMAGLEVR
jgi:phenylalanyl-tRNA synthetase beta chain